MGTANDWVDYEEEEQSWAKRTRAEHCTPLARTASITASTFFRRARTFALRVTESFQGDFLSNHATICQFSVSFENENHGEGGGEEDGKGLVVPEKTALSDERWSERAEHGCNN